MAATNNQGLQIALIILFILVLLLSVTSFTFFQQVNNLQLSAAAANQAATEKTASEEKMQGEFNKIMTFVGLEATGEQDLTRVEETFTEDMAKYGATLPEDKKSYHAAIEELFNSLAAKNAEAAKSKDQVDTLTAANKVFEEGSKKQTQEAEAAKVAAQEELKTEKAKYMKAQEDFTAERDTFTTQLDAAKKSGSAEIERLTKEVADAKSKIAVLEKSVGEFRGRVAEFMSAPGALPDGEIRLVDQRTRVVWINAGSADLLQRGTTFSIYSPKDQVGTPEAVKGRVEVTQILGEHLAEARILEDHQTNLIMPGDKVYTNLWTPGRPERIAIIGRISLDDDATTDESAQFIGMVKAHGGTVDAQLSNEGELSGKLTVNTRYLIVGTPPSERARATYDRLRDEAKQLGIEAITADRFLDNMGWLPAQQVVRFGRNSNIDKVPPDAPDGGMPRADGRMLPDKKAFEKRLPPAGQTTTSPAYVPIGG